MEPPWSSNICTHSPSVLSLSLIYLVALWTKPTSIIIDLFFTIIILNNSPKLFFSFCSSNRFKIHNRTQNTRRQYYFIGQTVPIKYCWRLAARNLIIHIQYFCFRSVFFDVVYKRIETVLAKNNFLTQCFSNFFLYLVFDAWSLAFGNLPKSFKLKVTMTLGGLAAQKLAKKRRYFDSLSNAYIK